MLMLAVTKSALSPEWFWYAFIGLAVLVGIIGLLKLRFERRRRETLALAAGQHGLSFDAAGEPLAPEEVKGFHLFSDGRARQTRNVMRGSSSGMEIVLFDYKYVTGSGKNQSVHQQTVAAFRLPGATLPGFDLRHENVLYKVAALFGYRDINFTEHPEFSRRYLLRGTDQDAVRALFSPALVQFFENPIHVDRRWAVEGAGNLLLVYRPEKRISGEALPQFLQDSTTVAAQFRQGTGAAKFGW